MLSVMLLLKRRKKRRKKKRRRRKQTGWRNSGISPSASLALSSLSLALRQVWDDPSGKNGGGEEGGREKGRENVKL